jgi:hypothetical protein
MDKGISRLDRWMGMDWREMDRGVDGCLGFASIMRARLHKRCIPVLGHISALLRSEINGIGFLSLSFQFE